MEVALDPRSEAFVTDAVRAGRFTSPTDAVGAGLRLLQEHEHAWAELRQSIQDAIERGGELGEEELDAHLEKVDQRLAAAGL